MAETEKDNEQIIETVDEEGNIVKFELIDIVSVDEVEYGLLMPLESSELEEDEAVLMRLKKEGEEFVFEGIEDDDEFEKVVEYIQNYEEELDEDEEE